MNREGNLYTFIYASVLVIVVAAALSFASTSLKPLQAKNVEIAKKIDILSSVNIASTALDAEELYDKYVKNTFIVNSKGDKLDGSAFDVDMKEELTKSVENRNLPVYIITLDDGGTKYVLPVRGKGLWGPIWGYVSLNEDKSTIFGATFGHKGETPGLGAEIATQNFQDQFKGKTLVENGEVSFFVMKGGAPAGKENAVDAVSGGTITSTGLQNMINDCLGAYETFLKK